MSVSRQAFERRKGRMLAKKIMLCVGATLLLLALPLVGACSSDEEATPTPAGTPVPTATSPSAIPLEIGLVAPLTGPAAAWGLPARRAFELVFEQVNEAGGITVGGQDYVLVLLANDDKYDPATAVTAVERLISQDDVKFLYVMTSDATMASQPLVEENEVIMFSSGTAPQILNADQFFTFRGSPSHVELFGPQMQWLMDEHPEVKRIAIVARDNTSGREARKTYETKSPELGLEVVFNDTYASGTTDFYPILTEVLAADPDVIGPVGAGFGQFIKQARELGYEGYFQTYTPQDADDLVEAAGAEAVEGVYYGGVAAEQATEDWKAAYTEKYGKFNSVSLMLEPVARVLIDGIERANSLDTRLVAKALEETRLETSGGTAVMTGAVTYGINRQFMLPGPIGTIVNGEGVVAAIIGVDDMLRGMGEL